MGDRALEYGIRKLAGTFGRDSVKLITGTVKSVDGNTCVVVIENDVELPNVQLQSAICDGLLITPKVDSMVTVITSIYGLPFVSQFSDIDNLYLQVGDSSLTVNNDATIQLNDGSFGGLIKIEKLVEKINALEDLLNGFINIYNGHTHVVSVAPGTSDPTLATESQTISPTTQKSDIENSDITHGE